MKILMVCLGNICRSPLAEGILRDKAKKAGLHWTIDSAGTGNYHIGEAPHRLSQKVSKLNGVDISFQQARQFHKNDMKHFDKIYVMDSDNYEEVKNLSQDLWNENKVDLLLNELHPFENREVPDPWYGTEEAYHRVYKLLDLACTAVIKKYEPVAIKK